MKLYPWKEIVEAVDPLIGAGVDCYQQFNCAHCGAKQTMDVPNKFHISGICEECGKETDIVKDGMNYMIHAKTASAVDSVLKRMGEK